MRRFPHSVYRHGTEPDPRFSLANERTFLAWIRTSLALIAVGLAVEALNLPISHALRTPTAITFVLLAVAAAGQAWLGWARTEHALRCNSVLPGPSSSVFLAGGVILAAALITAGLWL